MSTQIISPSSSTENLVGTTSTVCPQATHRNSAPSRRSVDRLLAQLDHQAENSDYLFRKPFGSYQSHGQTHPLPRYVFLGPKGGGDLIRIGLFATIHGDEPQGALAITRLVAALEQNPEIAKGYCLFLYPVCNPTGFEDNTRHSRNGLDLNREFWRGSSQPEVRWLETEIWTHAFDGIINLHADDTSSGTYGYVAGDILSKHLLDPALHQAEKFLPRNTNSLIDGFAAANGIITDCIPGVLRAPGKLYNPPFEITLETPHHSPLHLQIEAFNAALQTILVEYRYLLAIGQNI